MAVLMATFEGAKYIDEQLRSIAAQDWDAIDIWASDDGSTDGTVEVLQQWAANWRRGTFTILRGPGRGFADNFRALLVNSAIEADYVCFCDQDDIWLSDKTRAAIETLRPSGDRPALYCARTIIADESGRELQRSPLFRRPPNFANALVQSIGGGNTMVMNRAGHRLVQEAARRTPFVSHDWFSYLIIAGAGGAVTYAETPHVRYRQHPGNLVGSNHGWRAFGERILAAFGGRFSHWNDDNVRALEACRDMLTPQAVATLEMFREARRGPLLERLHKLRQSGVYRQTRFGQLTLYAAGLLGKL
ncbi:MAG: glycosyltransferase family 2 protein [Devosia sp.]|nr:glycosyltransferase family 2 protein [Devosia sp.]